MQTSINLGPTNSTNAKSLTATCPSGKHLLGTGAFIDDGFGQVMFDDIRPDALLLGVTVSSAEDESGSDGTHTTTAYAICANI